MSSRTYIVLLFSLVVAPVGEAADAHKYLLKVAKTYRHLKSVQVDATAERVQDVDGKHSRVLVRIALYSSPSRIRIDTKDPDNSARSVLLQSGGRITEFHAWDNEYALSPPEARLDVKFSPARGRGLGEMTYDTIADGVSKAALRGRQTLELGTARVSCVIVDVEYAGSIDKYSFWIMERKNLVLQRAVTYFDGSVINTVVSRVQALTANEEIPPIVFQFTPPDGAREVSISSWDMTRAR